MPRIAFTRPTQSLRAPLTAFIGRRGRRPTDETCRLASSRQCGLRFAASCFSLRCNHDQRHACLQASGNERLARHRRRRHPVECLPTGTHRALIAFSLAQRPLVLEEIKCLIDRGEGPLQAIRKTDREGIVQGISLTTILSSFHTPSMDHMRRDIWPSKGIFKNPHKPTSRSASGQP